VATQLQAESEVVTEQRTEAGWSNLWTLEDYWAIWLGALLLAIGLLIFLPNPPAEMHSKLDQHNAALEREVERAPFRSIAWNEAAAAKGRLRARDGELARTIGAYLARPGAWAADPVRSFYRGEETAAAERAAAAANHETARQASAMARARAEEAEASAAAAGFRDVGLNQRAQAEIAAWREAVDAEAGARAGASGRAYNLVPGLIVLCVGVALFFAIGMPFMGREVLPFLAGFPFVFFIATLASFLAAQETINAWGLEYVLWAIGLGLLISNTVGTPGWVMPAVQTEYYIKTGLVLLGASILFGKILLIGQAGVFVTWVVTPIVLVCTFWFGQRVLKMTSKTLNITISADMSVCGVTAAIATAAACRAKKEELTLAVGMSVAFTAVMMFVMPAFIKAVEMHHVLGGAWMGGTIDSTGAVVAAGALLGDTAMYVAGTIKMIQNVMIGVVAFAVAAYWCTKVERTPGVELGLGSALREIWYRFPKFVLGFVGASIVFSLIYEAMGHEAGRVMLDEGVVRGWTTPLQSWFFCLAFVSIGLATNFRELGRYFKGGKPLILYVCGQSFNILLTLIVAYLMFFVIFPGVTEKLMAQ
jgi:uncharacterized membrane protein YadS